MNHLLCRKALFLVLIVPTLLSLIGCQPPKIGDKPGDEMNKAMTEKQKAVIAEHKKQQDP